MAAVMPLIIDGRFDRVAAESDLAQWRQSLALLISHAERDSLSKLCGSLGDRSSDLFNRIFSKLADDYD